MVETTTPTHPDEHARRAALAAFDRQVSLEIAALAAPARMSGAADDDVVSRQSFAAPEAASPARAVRDDVWTRKSLVACEAPSPRQEAREAGDAESRQAEVDATWAAVIADLNATLPAGARLPESSEAT
jgi:hypothetical protein